MKKKAGAKKGYGRRKGYKHRGKSYYSRALSLKTPNPYPFPKMKKVVHTYVDTVSFGSATTSPAFYLFSCNNLYDPDYTGTGHQPMYFDQLTALYDHYCVIGSKISVTFNLVTGATYTPEAVGIYIEDDTSVTPNQNPSQMEQSGAVSYVFTPNTQTARLSLGWSARKYFGKSPLANTELQGTSTTGPTEQSYYSLWFHPIDNSANTVYATVKIEYITIWKELKRIAGS